MESKELEFESSFYPNCFHFLPLGESFINSFVFEAQRAGSTRVFDHMGVSAPNLHFLQASTVISNILYLTQFLQNFII